MEFPSGYFKTEIRDEFEIDDMMKRAWAASIEVLEVIDSICEKYKLTWFADWGTLLGAVRHQGFIPWDDDIDIGMLRKDYMKLIEVLPQELPQGFAIAGMYASEKKFRNEFRVQQLRIIADEKYWSLPTYMNRFHGFPCFRIGIDIFPLDYFPEDVNEQNYVCNLYYETMNILTHWESYCKRKDFGSKIKMLEAKYKTKFKNDDLYNAIWLASDRLIMECDESELVTNYFTYCMNKEKKKEFVLKKEWFENIEYHPFEFLEIPIPSGYDDILKMEFGDYMIPLKIYDAHEYPFYKTQLKALEKLLKESGITCSVNEFCNNWMKANNME